MEDITILPAGRDDVPDLNRALTLLSGALGDLHRVGERELMAAGFGQEPCFAALMARSGDALVGIVLFSPAFSTVRGGPGIHVSDLWIDPAFRRAGIGRRLLQAAIAEGRSQYDAGFVRLTVYDDSHDARFFYERLGFVRLRDEENLVLEEEPLKKLSREPQ